MFYLIKLSTSTFITNQYFNFFQLSLMKLFHLYYTTAYYIYLISFFLSVLLLISLQFYQQLIFIKY